MLLLGNFDGFHRGHRALLDRAKTIAAADAPLALMSCEPHPRTFFAATGSPFRLATPVTKAKQFGALGLAYVYSPEFDRAFAALSAEDFIRVVLKASLGVSHVVVGQDFRFGRERGGDVDLLSTLGRLHGFGVTTVGEVGAAGIRCSSSQIRAYIQDGDINAANHMLGRPWLAEFVMSGQDLLLSSLLCRPAAGRYRCRTDHGICDVALASDGRIEGRADLMPLPGLVEFLGRVA
ncbi:hypothetical protein [Labrys neptuniae]